ncbi:hypothetical protein PENTCL1PPCAC_14194 [Pristionchus entomophagus]|uniref:G protein-coupled receptor n=1 Tax=Pristionchus entomophagus TaxID=358040 RepID=A0AAV5TFE3_9BILA|nr:hypothetical protein PENTCL1PPCAC_14194 [Pristionchus entomophagus]
MSEEVFLSPENEQSLLLGERIVFVFSSTLNVLALFCLIGETPASQALIKNYLLFIQATVIASDFYFSVLFEPFPVLQLFAGYCVGLLCRAVQPTIVVGIYATLIGLMGASIVLCTIHRHQTIVMRGRWVLSRVWTKTELLLNNEHFQRSRSILTWLVCSIYCGPCLLFAVTPFDSAESSRLIEHSSPDLRWIRSRGGHFMLERTTFTLTIIAAVFALLILCIVIGVVIFTHLLVVLHRENSKSAKLKRSIRISLIRFFIQIDVPILFIVVPFTILVSEILFNCFSFNVCLVAMAIIPFHPIVHNLILVLIVPQYRGYLLKPIYACLERKLSKLPVSVRAPDSLLARY